MKKYYYSVLKGYALEVC